MVVTDKYLNVLITIRLGGKDVLSIECKVYVYIYGQSKVMISSG